MKLSINVRDHLQESSDHGGDLLLLHTSVDVDDLLDTNGIPEEAEFDLHELLAERHAIALLWDADMLVSTYPHLTQDQAWKVLQECERQYSALENADGLAIVTEWQEFRNPDFEQMKRLLREPVIFDGRNLYDPSHMHGLGFRYHGIGRAPGGDEATR